MGATASIPDSVNVVEIIAKTGKRKEDKKHMRFIGIIKYVFLLGLSRKKVSALWTRFYELDRDARGEAKGYKGYLEADDLSRIPKFDANPISPRLMKVIFDDFGTDGKLTFRQFVDFMSTFAQCERPGYDKNQVSIPTAASASTRTDLETTRYAADDSVKKRKIKFIFHVRCNDIAESFTFISIKMYDVDHDGRLSKEDVQEILKMMVK